MRAAFEEAWSRLQTTARALDLLRLSGNPQQAVLCRHFRAIRGSLAPAGGGGRVLASARLAAPKQNLGSGTVRSLVRRTGTETRPGAQDGAAVPVALAA